MAMDFVAIDLETANPNPWSICQIGIAEFSNGAFTGSWMSYIDPGERFNRDNVAIHGITEAAIQGWPKLPEVAEHLAQSLCGKVVVSHSQFDRIALEQAFDRLEIPRLNCSWLDSTLVARRAWEGLSKRGFGLENLCRLLGYRYQRHDALGDAKAAGVVVLAAIEQTGIGLRQWLDQVELPIGDGPRRPIQALSKLPPGTEDSTSREVTLPANQVISAELQRLLAVQRASDSVQN
jgi:DNA polymerase-3 subunit epsilon